MTTIDDPNEWDGLSTSITKDVGINALRQARITMEESMALASECIVAYRSTVKEQTTRIAELESKLTAAEHRIASQKVEILELEDTLLVRTNQANEFQRRMNEYRERVDELEFMLKDEQQARSNAALKPRSHSDLDIEQANEAHYPMQLRNKTSRMAEEFADLITMARTTAKADYDEEVVQLCLAVKARVNRIATAILRQLDADRPVFAYHLALTLQEESKDGNSDDGAADLSFGTRPDYVEPTSMPLASYEEVQHWVESIYGSPDRG